MTFIPGVPAVSSLVNLLPNVPLIIADALTFLTGFGSPQWGIFQDGEPVIVADSVISLGYKQDWAISTFPVEAGGFQSYNKVDTPFSARVRFASGGSVADREELLSSIAEIASTLDLFDVVTPEAVYTSVNVQGYNYIRTAQNGAGLLIVDVQLIEVRVTAVSQFSNTKSPSSQGQSNNGPVQTSAAPSSYANAVAAGIQPL